MNTVETKIVGSRLNEILRRKHLSVTDSRKKILSLFLNTKDALAHGDIEKKAGEKFPSRPATTNTPGTTGRRIIRLAMPRPLRIPRQTSPCTWQIRRRRHRTSMRTLRMGWRASRCWRL